jgi:hypothetical protein
VTGVGCAQEARANPPALAALNFKKSRRDIFFDIASSS